MGTNSVTGHGPGSVEGVVKGPQNRRSAFDPIVNPHIVAGGHGTTARASFRVIVNTYIPGNTLGRDRFAVIARGDVPAQVLKHNDGNGVFDYFDVGVVGEEPSDADWIIVSIGTA